MSNQNATVREPHPSDDQSVGADVLRLAGHEFSSRLIVGTGRFGSFPIMQQAIRAAGAQCVTVAVRREQLYDSRGQNILDFLDTDRLVLVPNTAGCYDAMTAVRCARMGREILRGLENPGCDLVKLEVLGDSRTLLPDPVETLKATEILVADGFQVLCYTSDDPVMARRLKDAGAAAVMPAGSPIGSGQGILNRLHLEIIVEQLKSGDPDYPLIVDAGIGTASDAAIAMELGADAVLLNTAIAGAKNPVLMAHAMRMGVQAGRLARLAGRIGKSMSAAASSPDVGLVGSHVEPGQSQRRE